MNNIVFYEEITADSNLRCITANVSIESRGAFTSNFSQYHKYHEQLPTLHLWVLSTLSPLNRL